MKIRDIHAIGLSGATPEGGWTTELQPEDSVHTLVLRATGVSTTPKFDHIEDVFL
jgi:hypothetical protein